MFPGNEVLQNFTLGRTKVTYLITEALAPHFKDQILDDIGERPFSLLYDETTNAAHKKELQTQVRFWSDSFDGIVTYPLSFCFMGHAKATDLQTKLYEALDSGNLSRGKILMLGSDGPYVNKKVEKLINEDIVSLREKPLIDLGTCNVHILHNAFLKGLEELGENACGFLYELETFFAKWPSRSEDFGKVQAELGIAPNRFIRYVDSRWLSVEPCASRAIEQWPAIQEYFLRFVPKNNKDLEKKDSYKKMLKFVKQPSLLAELHFIVSSARIFTKFTGFFQRDEPLVHLLYSHLKSLTETLILRAIKKSAYDTHGLSMSVFEKENYLPVDKVVCNDGMKKAMLGLKDLDKALFMSRVQKHYVKAAQEVLLKSSLVRKSYVRALRCLGPKERLTKRSLSEICEVARKLPIEVPTDALQDEWIMLQAEKDPETRNRGSSSETEAKNDSDELQIDRYWAHFFKLKTESGEKKYPLVTKVVQAALSLSHGNSVVERGFSSSGCTLSDDRTSMSEKTLNSCMIVKSFLEKYNNKPEQVPLTKSLLTKARQAHSKYVEYLESERRKKQALEEKKSQDKKEKEEAIAAQKKIEDEKSVLQQEEERLQALRKLEKEKKRIADGAIEVATKRMKTASDKKDFTEIGIAQAMLEGAHAAREIANQASKEAEKLQASVDKRKTKLLECVSKNKM